MPSSNYTVTSVVYTAASGTNVFNAHPTAVLTITPNIGYEIFAADFLWTNTDLNYINTVVFTQDGQNVLCTVTFDNPFTMPAANVDLALCISGSANISELCCDVDLCVEGDTVNYNVQAGSPIPEDITINVCGTEGQQIQLFQRTYTASSGYYLETQPSVVLEIGDQYQYAITETPTLNSDGKVVSVTVSVKYTFKSTCGVNDKVNIKLFTPLQIQVPRVKITNYTLNTSNVGSVGAQRILKVFGTPTATFSVSSNNGQILSIPSEVTQGEPFSLYTTTPTLTIPSIGFLEINIDIPALNSFAQYCFTLSGDLVDPFPQVNPVCINQIPDIVLTFNTSGSNLTTTSSTVNGVDYSNAVVTRESMANVATIPQSDFYNNIIVYNVESASGQTLSLVSNPTPSWTNLNEPFSTVTQEVINSPNISLNDNDEAAGITAGMRMTGNSVTLNNSVPAVCTVSSVSGSDIVVSPSQANLPFDPQVPEDLNVLTFSNRKGSVLNLPAYAVLGDSATTAKVFVNGQIERYGDTSQTFTLDLTSLITVGSSNPCKEFNVTVGTGGGTLVYFDCIKKTKRQLVVFKGESNFSICALTSPAPTVTGTMSIAQSGDVCDLSGVDATCVTWSIAYTNNPQGKSVDVTYFDCVTLAENTITVGRGLTVEQCATRQTPVSTSNGNDSGATITITNLTCTP